MEATVNAYDDPYVMLAHSIIARHTRSEIERILTDNEYVFKLILKEVRLQDFSGAFVDCIIEDILNNKRRMEMCHQLDQLSKYFYQKLDLKRLRKEVRSYGEKYGIL